MINKFIRNFVAKQIAGRSDDGIMITLKDPQRVTFAENILADLLMRNGIDPRAITSEAQLKTILNQIRSLETQAIKNTDVSGIRGTRQAEVFNIEGQSLDPNKPIIGGTQTGKELSKELSDRLAATNTQRIKQKIADKKVKNEPGSLMSVNKEGLAGMEYELPPKGSRGGPDDIAAPVQSSEESLKNMIEAENKKNISAMKKRKMLDEAIEDASPGFSNDTKYDAELVAENLAERMGLVYDDLPTKQKLDLYDQAYTGLSKQRFKGMKKPDDDPEEFQKGGIARIGLKDGMNRRTFLKFLGGAISLPIIGRFFKPAKGVSKVSKVPMIKTGDVPGKPEWFDQLVNRVIMEGDDVTKRFATQERQVVHMKKIDDETTVTVTQDLNDGSIMVDVDDPIRNVMGESGDDTSVQMMLKKNPGDESSPAGPDEFSFTEADMRNYMDGPDDYTTEFVENTVNKMSDLTSDLGKIKSYATGKKPTMKEFIESKKRQDKVRFAEEKPAEYAAERGPDIDYSDYEYASGGIARMLGE